MQNVKIEKMENVKNLEILGYCILDPSRGPGRSALTQCGGVRRHMESRRTPPAMSSSRALHPPHWSQREVHLGPAPLSVYARGTGAQVIRWDGHLAAPSCTCA